MMKFSLLGAYQYNPDIFADFMDVVAEIRYRKVDADGNPIDEVDVDWPRLVDTILIEYGSFGVIHPVSTLNYTYGLWARSNAYFIRTLIRTTLMEYNPIENFDRFEEYSDSTQGSNTTKSNNKSNGSDTTVEAVKGYNTAEGLTDSTSTKNSSQAAQEASGQSTNENKATHTGHLHGNIGVTTTQQMLEAERQIALFDAYHQIANKFALDNLIGIYC